MNVKISGGISNKCHLSHSNKTIKSIPEAIMIHKGTNLGRKPSLVYEKSKVKNFLLLMKLNANWLQKICFTLFLPIRAAMFATKLIFNGNAKIILEHFKGLLQGIHYLKISAKSNR